MSPPEKRESTSGNVPWWEIVFLGIASVLALVAGTVVVHEGMSVFNALGFAPLVGAFVWFAWKHDIVGTPKRRKP